MKNLNTMDWALLTKYISGECNETEMAEVEKWIAQSESNREEFDSLVKMLSKTDEAFKLQKFDSAEAWNKVKARTSAKENKTIRLISFKRFYKYAAILVLAFVLGSTAIYLAISRGQDQTVEIASADKIITGLVLPDGTEVALNNNSTLIYPEEFEGDKREVTIIGEAFFDVTPNPDKPFIIHAGDALVKVVGTSFNVNAYPDNEVTEVIVATGKVEVTHDTPEPAASQEKIVLTPGEKGILAGRKGKIVKQENTDRNYLAWKTQSLEFNETPLSEVVAQLQKVYLADIVIVDEELNDLVLTARFDQKPVEFILNVIKMTFNLELTIENNQYRLSKNNEQ